MGVATLIIKEKEWEGPGRGQLEEQCREAGLSLVQIGSWQDLSDVPGKETALVMSCTDSGILTAKREHLPVLAFRNSELEQMCGKQELYGTTYLLEDIGEADGVLFRKAYAREKGLPVQIGATPRCVIREISPDDIHCLYELQNGKINSESLHPMQLPFPEYRDFWESYCREQYGFFDYGFWLVTADCKGAEQIIGVAGFEDSEQESGLELGYWIAEKYRQKGYAKEVCAFLLQYASEQLEAEEVSVFIRPDNLPSIRLAESLGFLEKPFTGKEEKQALQYMKSLQFL